MPTAQPFLEPLEPRLSLSSVPHATLVKDINPGPEGSMLSSRYGSEIIAFQDKAFFTADDGLHGLALWKSDGSAQGTVMVRSFGKGAFPWQLQELNGMLYFRLGGAELWTSDGTTRGTHLIKRFHNLPQSRLPRTFVSFRNRVAFVMDDGSHVWLWITNGTPKGTIRLKNLDSYALQSFPTPQLTVVGKNLFFVDRQSLWKTDGTLKGTIRLRGFPNGTKNDPDNLTAFGNSLYFTVTDDYPLQSWWKTNGTRRGTLKINERFEYVWMPTVADNSLYFAAATRRTEQGLWKARQNLDELSAVKLPEIRRGIAIDDPFMATVGQDDLYFTTTDGSSDQLWRTLDGGEAVFLMDLPDAAFVDELTNVHDTVYFTADYSSHFIKSSGHLWRSDGTPQGTRIIASFGEAIGAGPSNLTPVGNSLFFMADDGNSGYEPWLI
jgi:ELWxxDGT repeat protein